MCLYSIHSMWTTPGYDTLGLVARARIYCICRAAGGYDCSSDCVAADVWWGQWSNCLQKKSPAKRPRAVEYDSDLFNVSEIHVATHFCFCNLQIYMKCDKTINIWTAPTTMSYGSLRSTWDPKLWLTTHLLSNDNCIIMFTNKSWVGQP